MPKCCACNSTGVCKVCSCVRAGRVCFDCAPSRHNRCLNAVLPGSDEASQSQSATQPLIRTGTTARNKPNMCSQPALTHVGTSDKSRSSSMSASSSSLLSFLGPSTQSRQQDLAVSQSDAATAPIRQQAGLQSEGAGGMSSEKASGLSQFLAYPSSFVSSSFSLPSSSMPSSSLLSSQTPERLRSTRFSRRCNSTGGPSSRERQENEHPRVNN